MASVSHTRWAFYEAKEVKDVDTMADWFETLYHHYQQRGKRIKARLANNQEHHAPAEQSAP